MVFVAISCTGEGDTPKAYSSRILIAGFWFFCTVIMATYTANLAAFLTVSRLQSTIASLDDLANQNDVTYSILAKSDSETYFKHMSDIESTFYDRWKEMSLGSVTSKSTVDESSQYAVWDYPLGDKFTRIWNKLKVTGFINSTKEGVQKVLDGNFAFLHSSPMLKYEVNQRCDLIVVGDQFSTKPYAFALQQNSPLVKKIDDEYGHFHYLRIYVSPIMTETW